MQFKLICLLRFYNRVVYGGWPSKTVPYFPSVFEICKKLIHWLKKDPNNVVVIHCEVSIFNSR